MIEFTITQEQYDNIIDTQSRPFMKVGDVWLNDTSHLWQAIGREHGVDWKSIAPGPDPQNPLLMKGEPLAS